MQISKRGAELINTLISAHSKSLYGGGTEAGDAYQEAGSALEYYIARLEVKAELLKTASYLKSPTVKNQLSALLAEMERLAKEDDQY